jgi:hypothetical protein
MSNRVHSPALVFLACVAGCSDNLRTEVAGTVMLNGVPLEEGSIQFIPVEGNRGPGAGAVIRNGRYLVPRSAGVTPGRNRVELRAFRDSGRMVQDPTGPPGALAKERVPAFPPEFNESSTLIRDVRKGTDTIDFDIQVADPPKATGKR